MIEEILKDMYISDFACLSFLKSFFTALNVSVTALNVFKPKNSKLAFLYTSFGGPVANYYRIG